MPLKITKAVIPVAGLGTRFLPATKAQPKEMMPVVDKPVIQYIVEDAIKAGIRDIILITGQTKRSIEDHFDRNFELEYRLEQKNKKDLLQLVKSISRLANFTYVRQPAPLGDGHAILQAKPLIKKNEHFVVLFGDDINDSKRSVVQQMLDVFQKNKGVIIAVEKVHKTRVDRYGIIGGKQKERRLHIVDTLVEKPKPENAPSNLAVVGKYIVPAKIFSCIENAVPSIDGEIRLIDGLIILMMKKYPIFAYEFQGKRFDTGDKLEYLKSVIHFGLKHPEVKDGLREYLSKLKL